MDRGIAVLAAALQLLKEASWMQGRVRAPLE